jgi:hypothetical protein
MSTAPTAVTFYFYILFFPFTFFVSSGVWESHGHVLVELACQSCVEIKKNQSAYISHFLFIHPAVSEWNNVNVCASYSFIRCNDFIAFRNKLCVLLPFSTRSSLVLEHVMMILHRQITYRPVVVFGRASSVWKEMGLTVANLRCPFVAANLVIVTRATVCPKPNAQLRKNYALASHCRRIAWTPDQYYSRLLTL